MLQKIYLAGGCFWGVEAYFSLLNGIVATRVGYANSDYINPTYQQVCSGETHAIEALEILYDDNKIGLDSQCNSDTQTQDNAIPDCILSRFFSIIDPCALNYQGNDFGTQYRSGIYTNDKEMIERVEHFIDRHIKPLYEKRIVVEVELLKNFYEAEEYHQQYLAKNPQGYCHIDIRNACKPLMLGKH